MKVNTMNDTDVPVLTGDKCNCGRPVPEPFRVANAGRIIACSVCKSRWRMPTVATVTTAPPAPPEPTVTTPVASVPAPAPAPTTIIEAATQAAERREAPPLPEFVDQREAVQLLNDKCVVIETSYRKPGTDRKIGRSEIRVEATGAGGAPDQKRIKAHKILWDCKEYRAIGTHDSRTQLKIDRLALPQSELVREGSRVVLLTDIEKIVKELDEKDEPTRQQLITAFVEVYPQLIEKAKKSEAEGGLGALFNERDFPSPGAEVRQAFLASNGRAIYRRIRVASDTAPASLKSVSEELLRKELEEAAREGTGLVTQVRDGLRLAFSKLVTTLVEKLKTQPGEAAKGFKAANVEKLKTFIDDFLALGDKSRNVTNDTTLKGLAERAKAIISGVDVEQLREKADVKATFEAAVSTIKAEMDQFIQAKPKRKYGAAE